MFQLLFARMRDSSTSLKYNLPIASFFELFLKYRATLCRMDVRVSQYFAFQKIRGLESKNIYLESYVFAGTVHTTSLSEDMRVAGSMHRDIEVKEVYLFSKMRFPPRSLYKSLKSKDRRMITALAASIQRHFRFSWTYKFLKCVLFFSQNVYIYDFNMQLTSTKETSFVTRSHW